METATESCRSRRFPSSFRSIFGAIDQNGDGKVDVNEATNFVKLTGGLGGRGQGQRPGQPVRGARRLRGGSGGG